MSRPQPARQPERSKALLVSLNVVFPVFLIVASMFAHGSLRSALRDERARTAALQSEHQRLGNPDLEQRDLTARLQQATQAQASLGAILMPPAPLMTAANAIVRHYAAVSRDESPSISFTSWTLERVTTEGEAAGQTAFAMTLLGYATDLTNLESFLARLEDDPAIDVHFERANRGASSDVLEPYAFHLEFDVRADAPVIEATVR